MEIFDKVSVIIPSLDPDEKLMKVVSGLTELGFNDIIVVNDGSRKEKLCNFPDTAKQKNCVILTHEVNKGKGAALKTAFEWFMKNRPERLGVITVDGDNQHKPLDVLACAEKMLESETLVLGVRDFSLPHVPRRSRMGNRITSGVFRVLIGMKVSDTQTGLRAFPRSILPQMCEVKGDRFEYETNMLLALSSYGIKHSEVKIETVYIEENQTSHFRPVRDSLRVYSLILKFVLSSAVCAILDHLLFFLIKYFFGKYFVPYSIIASMIPARAVSSVTNFLVNRKTVFGSSESIPKTILKYYALAIPMLLISCIGIDLVTAWLGITHAIFITLIKIVIEAILYILSFRFQREWVFASKKK